MRARRHSHKARREKKLQMRIYRGSLFLIFLLVATLLAVLSILRKSSEVDITLKTTRFSVDIHDQRFVDLFSWVKTDSLSLTNFARVDLQEGALEFVNINAQTKSSHNSHRSIHNGQVHIIAKEPNASLSLEGVTLNQLRLKNGSTLIVRWNENEPNSVSLVLDQSPSGEIAAPKTLRFTCNYCTVVAGTDTIEVESGSFRLTGRESEGSLLEFLGGASETVLGLEVSSSTPLKESDVRIGSANIKNSFAQLDRDRLVSTITEGRITFDEFDGSEVLLKPGHFLVIADSRDFVIKNIRIDNGINMNLHGLVGKLLTGPDQYSLKDRVPSLLQYIYARKSWVLWVSGLVSVLTIALAALERLRVFPMKE